MKAHKWGVFTECTTSPSSRKMSSIYFKSPILLDPFRSFRCLSWVCDTPLELSKAAGKLQSKSELADSRPAVGSGGPSRRQPSPAVARSLHSTRLQSWQLGVRAASTRRFLKADGTHHSTGPTGMKIIQDVVITPGSLHISAV